MIVRYLRQDGLDLIMQGIVIVLVYKVMDSYLATINIPLKDFTILLLIILFLIVWGWIKEYFQRKKVVSFVDEKFNINRTAVVFTLGISSHDSKSPQSKVMNTLSPKFMGFITTKEIEENRNVAQQIVSNRGLDNNQYRIKEVAPTNIKEIKESVTHILDWLLKESIAREKIVVDITGGTAVMSCGAFEAAKEYGIDTQYIYSDYDFNQNKVIPDTQKALIVKG